MAELILVNGNKTLHGEVVVSGSKNAAVALIIAAILSQGVVTLTNVPDIEDVRKIIAICKLIHVDIVREKDQLTIDARNVTNMDLTMDEMICFRASYYFMGVFLSLFNHIKICGPGGCRIGGRPIDLHIEGFRKMGVTINEENNVYEMSAQELSGNTIVMKKASVGATINIMLAAAKCKGVVIIQNAAKEPEIVEVARLINLMGGYVKGAGGSTIIIGGRKKLFDARMEIIPDRIEAGSYLIIGACIGNQLKVKKVEPLHLTALLNVLNEVGCKVKIEEDSITISKGNGYRPISIATDVYPGFPTDLQQPLSVLLSLCDGVSDVEETIFENRFAHVRELHKMGAKIEVDRSKLIIYPSILKGAKIEGKDLRGGMALVLAALIAEGKSEIQGVEFINRGYGNLISKLSSIGADIKICEE